MKRLVIGLMIGLSICSLAASARAQVYYEFPRATVLKKGEYAAGPFFAIGDNELVRLGGYGRLPLIDYLDMGAEVLLDNVSGDFRGGAGFDLKYQLFPNNSQIPFDVAANAGLGFTSGANLFTLDVPVGVVVSSPWMLDSGASLIPYAGIYLLYGYSKIERSGLPNFTDNTLDVEARLGMAYEVKPARQLFATLHVGKDTAFYVGFNFDLK